MGAPDLTYYTVQIPTTHLVTGILRWMEFNYCETQHHAHAQADFFNTLKRYVCLLNFSSYSRIYPSYGDFTIIDEGLQILAYVHRIYGHWGVMILQHDIHVPSMTRNIRFKDDLRGPVTLTHIAMHLAVELSLHISRTHVCYGRESNTQPSAWKGPPLSLNPTARSNTGHISV